jgi:type III secretion protein C
VDNVPPVQKMTINTQAIVSAEQSLILGGFYHERRTDGKSGTPGLMNMRTFGSLFGRTRQNVQRMERLIIISPRIISYDALDAPLPERLEEQRFALQPTAGNYELREDFYNVAPPRGSGCASNVVRPAPGMGPDQGHSP